MKKQLLLMMNLKSIPTYLQNSIIVLRNERNDLISGAVMTLDGTQYGQ